MFDSERRSRPRSWRRFGAGRCARRKSAFSFIQTMVARTDWRPRRGRRREWSKSPARYVYLVGQREHDRLTGDGFGQVSVASHDPSDLGDSPEGWTRIESPGRTEPATIVPEKPRKSGFGRMTYCTACVAVWSPAATGRPSTLYSSSISLALVQAWPANARRRCRH